MISIVVPTFNRSHLLIETVKSILNQTYKDFELIVISDGAPVDDSTLSVNKPNILENHLKETVLGIEHENKINLVAIGIGHDVSKYYKKAFTIDSPDKLGDVIIDNLAKNLKE